MEKICNRNGGSLMSKYFILSVDSFVNAFSLLDTTTTIRYQYRQAGSMTNNLGITSGDKVLVYKRNPISTINIALEALSQDSFQKLLEVGQGITLEGITLADDPEEKTIIEIDKVLYDLILKNLVSQIEIDEQEADTQDMTVQAVTGGKNVLFYGVPGCGKSHMVNNICKDQARIEKVVFHPDYTYSDFVGQILPKVNAEQELEYEFTPGPFTEILKKAFHKPGTMFYLEIEELNRGNASAIFGEIFQLLDRDSNGKSKFSVTNYDVAKIVFEGIPEFEAPEQKIFIPSNLTILATMNTSDQNVFTLDTAFQRRWEMRMIPNKFNDSHALDMIADSVISWGAFATTVNDIVIERTAEYDGSGDKRLGAYFALRDELSREIFPEKVLKYLWDDAFKMSRADLFSETMKSLDNVIETYQGAIGDPLKAVLSIAAYNLMLEKMRLTGNQDGEDNTSTENDSLEEEE